MKQVCKIIEFGVSTAIMCGGESINHKCNENAICYDTNEGRIFFNDNKEAEKWSKDNYKNIRGGSVSCSICGRAAIDNAMWL